jgi:inosine-uridine nucleoside N-ribohydrolase
MKIHLDTDLGGDIDDLCALAMLLKWPGVELVGVTTVADHQGKRAGYTGYALGLAGRDQVPVAAGADVSLGCYRSTPGLPEEARYWPEPVPPKAGPLDQALDLLEKSIREDAIIAAVGPYTNLALLEKRAPGILSQARLFLMGGYLVPVRSGFPPWDGAVDFNVQVDAQSANLVFESSDPTLIPLSVTVETSLRRAYLPRLQQSGPLGQLIARQAEAFAEDLKYETLFGRTCERLPPDTINFQHDPLACAIALGWDQGVVIEKIPVSSTIVDGWMQQKIVPGGKMTGVVCAVDGPAFSAFWVKVVTSKKAMS